MDESLILWIVFFVNFDCHMFVFLVVYFSVDQIADTTHFY